MTESRTEAEIETEMADFREFLAELVPHPESWPWFTEHRADVERFAAEAFRQGRDRVEVKALIGVDLANRAL
jgi:hypothetical protein